MIPLLNLARALMPLPNRIHHSPKPIQVAPKKAAFLSEWRKKLILVKKPKQNTHIHTSSLHLLGRNYSVWLYFLIFWQIKDMWKAHQFDGRSNSNRTAAFAIKRLDCQHTPRQTEATPNHINSRNFLKSMLSHLKCGSLAATRATIHMQKQRIISELFLNSQVWKSRDEVLRNVCNIMLHRSLKFSPSST